MTPTQRTLKAMRDEGWLCAVVEKWNPHAKVRQDLFGFIDVLAIDGNLTLGIQTTSGGNMANRVAKIVAHPDARLWLSSPSRQIQVHGWARRGPRGKRKIWTLRQLIIELDDLDDPQPLISMAEEDPHV